ncbi:MAG: DNA polymerase III subunit gamma/tau [Candidatus Flexifilum sp.]
MPEQALYLKWRPQAFEDVIGQEHITRTLRSAMRADRVRHAYLFSGPRGTGKTTTARLLAKAVNCLDPDVNRRPCNVCASCVAVNEGRFLDLIEIDAATHTGVDDVRDLRDKIAFAPGEGRYKVYIIDEVHRFSGSAFDALLKTLEEPPEHALFVLATTEIDKVPQTIKSRCLQFEFRRLSVHEVADRLERICAAEGLRYERAALELVAREGTGSVRDSISLLDQIVTDPDEPVTVDLVQRVLGTASSAAVRELVDCIAAGDAGGGLRVIAAAINHGTDPKQFGQQIVEHLRHVLIAATAGADLIEASAAERALYEQQAARIPRSTLIRALRIFNEAVNSYRGGWQPQLTLELALVEALHAPESAPVEAPAPVRAAAPAPAVEAPPPPVDETGEAVVQAAAINDRWADVLRVMGGINPQSPAVMEHYRAVQVKGNHVVLGTTNPLFFNRIHGHTEKIKIVEQALSRYFRRQLRVSVTLLNSDGSLPGGSSSFPPDRVMRSFGARDQQENS